MTVPLASLLGFALWTVLLVLLLVSVRVGKVLRGEKAANEFPAGVPHGEDWYWRLNRAHLNCTENLPVFGAVIVVGTLAGTATPLFTWLPVAVLALRLVQSSAHLASGSAAAATFRFSCFALQLVGLLVLAVEVVRTSA